MVAITADAWSGMQVIAIIQMTLYQVGQLQSDAAPRSSDNGTAGEKAVQPVQRKMLHVQHVDVLRDELLNFHESFASNSKNVYKVCLKC